MLAVHQREENGTAQLGGVLRFGLGLKAFPIAMIVVWIVLLLWIKLVIDPPPASPGDRLYVLALSRKYLGSCHILGSSFRSLATR